MMALQSPLRKQLTDWPQSRQPDPQAVAHRPGAAQGHQTEPPAVEFLDYGPAGRDAAGACELVPTFVINYSNVQGGGRHVHASFRVLGGDFGK